MLIKTAYMLIMQYISKPAKSMIHETPNTTDKRDIRIREDGDDPKRGRRRRC
jgi:hypothetical protein